MFPYHLQIAQENLEEDKKRINRDLDGQLKVTVRQGLCYLLVTTAKCDTIT